MLRRLRNNTRTKTSGGPQSPRSGLPVRDQAMTPTWVCASRAASARAPTAVAAPAYPVCGNRPESGIENRRQFHRHSAHWCAPPLFGVRLEVIFRRRHQPRRQAPPKITARTPQLLHHRYKKALGFYSRFAILRGANGTSIIWGASNHEKPATRPYTSATVSGNGCKCCEHSLPCVNQKFRISTNSSGGSADIATSTPTSPTPTSPTTPRATTPLLPIKGDKDFDSFGRSSSAGPANQR
jgi:hypothetical protein